MRGGSSGQSDGGRISHRHRPAPPHATVTLSPRELARLPHPVLLLFRSRHRMASAGDCDEGGQHNFREDKGRSTCSQFTHPPRICASITILDNQLTPHTDQTIRREHPVLPVLCAVQLSALDRSVSRSSVACSGRCALLTAEPLASLTLGLRPASVSAHQRWNRRRTRRQARHRLHKVRPHAV